MFSVFGQVSTEELGAAAGSLLGDGAETLPGASYCEEFLRQYTCWLLRSHSSQQPAKTLPEKHPQEPLPVICRRSFTSSVPTVGSLWLLLPPWTALLLTSGSVVMLPAKACAWSSLSGRLILSQRGRQCAIKGHRKQYERWSKTYLTWCTWV